MMASGIAEGGLYGNASCRMRNSERQRERSHGPIVITDSDIEQWEGPQLKRITAYSTLW
jgi:hypothetical protein